MRPTRTDGLRGRMHLAPVAVVRVTVRAQPGTVYRALKANAEGRGGRLEWAEVLERSGNELSCDFWTEIRLSRRLRIRFRTRESVELDPPLRVHYRHRSGPSRGLAETIEIQPIGGDASRVVYRATYPSPWRWWALLFTAVAKPVAHVFMRVHFRELRRVVERRG
jgi:hypothetical protein